MLGPSNQTTPDEYKTGTTLAIVHCATTGVVEEGSLTSLVTLPHPRTGEGVYFALSKKALLQVTRHADDKRSCFVGDNVLQDGSFLMMTPFDPLFLFLPLLESPASTNDDEMPPSKRNRGEYESPARRFEQLENILHSDNYPLLSQLAELEGIEEKLRLICDVDATVKGMTFYRLNDDKTKAWLLEKANKLLAKYESYSLLKVNGQWEDSLSAEEKQEHRKTMVHKIICEVLPVGKWPEVLKEAMGLNSMLNKAALNATNLSKAVYADPRIAPPAPAKKPDIGKKPTGKAAPKASTKKPVSTKGMAPLTSFFGKK